MTEHDGHVLSLDLDIVVSDEVLYGMTRLPILKEHCSLFGGGVPNPSFREFFEQLLLGPSYGDSVNCKGICLPRVLQFLLSDWNNLPLEIETDPYSVADCPIKSLDCCAF